MEDEYKHLLKRAGTWKTRRGGGGFASENCQTRGGQVHSRGRGTSWGVQMMRHKESHGCLGSEKHATARPDIGTDKVLQRSVGPEKGQRRVTRGELPPKNPPKKKKKKKKKRKKKTRKKKKPNPPKTPNRPSTKTALAPGESEKEKKLPKTSPSFQTPPQKKPKKKKRQKKKTLFSNPFPKSPPPLPPLTHKFTPTSDHKKRKFSHKLCFSKEDRELGKHNKGGSK